MTHNNVTRTQKSSAFIICKRQRRVLSNRSEKLMATKVLKLLKMEATTKTANEASAAAASSSSTTTTGNAPVDGAAAGGGGTECLDNDSEFYNTGRVGRRNALPDILNHHHSTTSTADLPDKLSALSTSDGSEAGASK